MLRATPGLEMHDSDSDQEARMEEDPELQPATEKSGPGRKTADQIMAEAQPMKSAKFYAVAWDKFMQYREEVNESVPWDEPTENDYITYFHFLKEEMQYKSSSLWTTFSKLNSVHQVCILLIMSNKISQITLLKLKYHS